jgi:hypothetical protein
MQRWEICGQFLHTLEKIVFNMEQSFGWLKFGNIEGKIE